KLLHRLQRRAPKRSKLQVRPTSRRCSRLFGGRDPHPTLPRKRGGEGGGVALLPRSRQYAGAWNSEIPMADPDDRSRQEGGSPDGRPRRQPPTIDVEAVEVSPDGSRRTTAGSGPPAGLSGAMRSLRWILTLRPPMKGVIIGSVCVMAAIIGGGLW